MGRATFLGLLFAAAISLSAGASEPQPGDLLNLPYFEDVVGGRRPNAGTLDSGGDTLRFVSIPARFTLRPLERHRWGARLRFELSFGLLGFESFLRDLDFGRVKALTLLPGIELPVRANDWLVVRPYVDLGAGVVSDGGGWSFLSRTGLILETEHRWHRFLLQLEPKLEYTLNRSSGPTLEEGLGLVGLKLGARHPLGITLRSTRLDAGAYFDFDYYFDDVELRSPAGPPTRIDQQYEVGLSIGPAEVAKVWKLSVPRFAVGYRFGDGVCGIHIVLGGRF